MVLNSNLLQTLAALVAEYTLQRLYNSNLNCSGCTLLMMSPQKGLEKNYILKLETLKQLSHIHAHSATLFILLLVAPWSVLVCFFYQSFFCSEFECSRPCSGFNQIVRANHQQHCQMYHFLARVERKEK